MAIQKIYLGVTTGDKKGDGAKLAGQKINASLEYLDEAVKALSEKDPYNQFKFIQKGFGNNDLQNDETGDIFCGWSDDGTLRYPEAKWLGGPLNTANSFEPLITIIIE